MLVFVGFLFAQPEWPTWQPPAPGAIDGVYEVLRQSGNDVSWQHVHVRDTMFRFKRAGEPWTFAKLAADTESQTLSAENRALKWSRAGTNVVLTGTWDGHDVELTLQKLENARQPIVTRGFHWVQDSPVNN